MPCTTSSTAHGLSQSQKLFFSKIPNTGNFSKPLGYAFPKTRIELYKPFQVAKLSSLLSQNFNGHNWSAMKKSTIKSKAESISTSKKKQPKKINKINSRIKSRLNQFRLILINISKSIQKPSIFFDSNQYRMLRGDWAVDGGDIVDLADQDQTWVVGDSQAMVCQRNDQCKGT